MPISKRSHTLCLTLLSLAVGGVAVLESAPHRIEVTGFASGTGWAGSDYFVLDDALREARELRRRGDSSVREGVRIVLGDGYYPLVEPLLIRPEDSGTADAPTILEAAPGTRPVVTGGLPARGWSILEEAIPGLPEAAVGKVWTAPSPRIGGRIVEHRHLWVNGKRAFRARDHFEQDMRRILEWDKAGRVGWIPAAELKEIPEAGRMEMIVHQMWAIAILRIKEIFIEGERARLTFHEPDSRIQFQHPWPPVVISDSGNSAYYLANHPVFLDQPGEWYQDLERGRLFYWPREGEQPDSTVAFVPNLETLVTVEGTVDRPVSHIRFKGIQFSHTDWDRPSWKGHVPLQAGMYLLDAYKLKQPGTPDKAGLENQAWIGRQPAAVEVKGGISIQFSNCHFRHLGASGLDLIEAVSQARVEGNLFRDIGSNGVVIGAFPDRGIETHLPYDPSDERVLCREIVVRNNLVTDVANVDWGCVGILAGFVRDVTISQNEICDVSYTGISLGWGWTFTPNALRNNRIEANHIHHFGKRMYDTGGIYTLSPQPNTSISENFIHSIYRPGYVHDPNHWSYIYLDEGSSYIEVRDNWTEALKYSTNANGPGNTWTNNGPSVSAKILQRAGLEKPYRGLREFATVKPEDPVTFPEN